MNNVLSFVESNNQAFFKELYKNIFDIMSTLNVKIKITETGSVRYHQEKLMAYIVENFNKTQFASDNEITMNEIYSKLVLNANNKFNKNNFFSKITLDFYRNHKLQTHVKVSEIQHDLFFNDNNNGIDQLHFMLKKSETFLKFGKASSYMSRVHILHNEDSNKVLVSHKDSSLLEVSNLSVHKILQLLPEIYGNKPEKFIDYFFKSKELSQEEKDILFLTYDIKMNALDFLRLDFTNKNKIKDKNVLAAH